MPILEPSDALGANDAGGGPSGEDAAIEDRHEAETEGVQDEGRHDAEAAAVTEKDIADQRAKQPRVSNLHQHDECHYLCCQHDAKRRQLPQPVRRSAPEKASQAVEDGTDCNQGSAVSGECDR